MKFYLMLILVVLMNNRGLPQSVHVDSMYVLDTIKNDSARIIAYASYAYSMKYKNPLLGIGVAQKALSLARTYRNRVPEVISSNVLGALHRFSSEYNLSMQYHLYALKMATQIRDFKRMANTLNYLGLLSMTLEDFPRAISYFEQGISFSRILKEMRYEAFMLGNIGDAYIGLKKYDSALYFLRYSDSLDMSIKNYDGWDWNKMSQGIVFFHLKDFKQAKRMLDTALYKFEITGNENGRALTYGWLGRLYLETSLHSSTSTPDLSAAKAMLEKAVSLQETLRDVKGLSENLRSLADVYDKLGYSKYAYQTLLKYNLYIDSLKNEDMIKRIARTEISYEFTQREDSIKYRSGLYRLQLSQNKLRTRQQWTIAGFALLAILTIGVVVVYKSHLQRAKLKAELAKEKADQEIATAAFQTKMSDAALSSLRAQMNPHFIFNCLNSIKLYAAKNNSEAATVYLSKFSRLMRLVLENSKNDRVTLKQEIETIGLYLEMEAMRFKQKLKYTISVANDLDQDFTELPPMIIQPYLENAIWHGLMHKEEGGRLDLSIEETENEYLLIKITDNGIGRVKAAELKRRDNVGHKSFGMQITNARLELLSSKYNFQTEVSVKDLYEAGEPIGTKVIIKIPAI